MWTGTSGKGPKGAKGDHGREQKVQYVGMGTPWMWCRAEGEAHWHAGFTVRQH